MSYGKDDQTQPITRSMSAPGEDASFPAAVGFIATTASSTGCYCCLTDIYLYIYIYIHNVNTCMCVLLWYASFWPYCQFIWIYDTYPGIEAILTLMMLQTEYYYHFGHNGNLIWLRVEYKYCHIQMLLNLFVQGSFKGHGHGENVCYRD